MMKRFPLINRYPFATLYHGLSVLLVLVLLVSCGTSRRRAALDNRQSSGYSLNRPVPSGPEAYIQQYKDIAIEEMNRYGIPASIKLAQGILESGNGSSYLATRANNHFGIKCGSGWKGKSIHRRDDSPNDCFRVYNNPEDSFRDHSQFLLKKRYEKLFKLKKGDYKGWAKGLRKAGYATNPRYPQLLIDLIERYNLHQYDSFKTSRKSRRNASRLAGLEAPVAPVEESQVRSTTAEKTVATQSRVAPAAKPEQIEEPAVMEKAPAKMNIYEVKTGETLGIIARRFGLSSEELKQINGLDTESVSVGQLLIVSK